MDVSQAAGKGMHGPTRLGPLRASQLTRRFTMSQNVFHVKQVRPRHDTSITGNTSFSCPKGEATLLLSFTTPLSLRICTR